MKVYSKIVEELEVGTVHVGVHRDANGRPLVVVGDLVVGTLDDTIAFLERAKEAGQLGEKSPIVLVDDEVKR